MGVSSQEDPLTLYDKCGDAVHRAGLLKLLDPNNQPPADFRDMQDWGQRILNLVSVHLISRVGGNVLVSIAESPKS